jgi:hypothetical protein
MRLKDGIPTSSHAKDGIALPTRAHVLSAGIFQSISLPVAFAGCAYMVFTTTAIALQACFMGLVGVEALQWSKLF